MALDSVMLKILCCPVCHSDLELNSKSCLVCLGCKREFLVKDEIPILLV